MHELKRLKYSSWELILRIQATVNYWLYFKQDYLQTYPDRTRQHSRVRDTSLQEILIFSSAFIHKTHHYKQN